MKTDNPPTPAEEKPRTWVIWKFALQNQSMQVLKIPKNARLLSVGAHEGEPCLWAMIEPQAEKESRVIEIIRKSEAFGDYARTFIGTVQLPQLDLVLHVFEKTSPVFRAWSGQESRFFATEQEALDWLHAWARPANLVFGERAVIARGVDREGDCGLEEIAFTTPA